MQEDTIIQKNLFAIDIENNEEKEITKIPDEITRISSNPKFFKLNFMID